jgi:hypothetical protein
MSTTVRNVLAVVGGAVAAVAVVALSDMVVGRVYPLPSALELSNADTARAAIAAVPLVALLLLVFGWGLAGGIGAFVAVRLAPEHRMAVGLVVAGLLVLATVANLAMIPHPLWMWPASLILIPVLGWTGARGAESMAARRVEQVAPLA